MFPPLPLWIGLRYARSRRRSHFVSFISLTSMVGIAVGVAVLITVMAVMNGFEREVRLRLLDTVAHASLTGSGNRLENWQEADGAAHNHPQVVAAAPFVSGGAMITLGHGEASGVLVRGVLPGKEETVSALSARMVSGRLEDLHSGERGVILGKSLADRLGISLGGKVTLVTARTSGSDTTPQLNRFTVVGTFDLGLRQYDTALILLHLTDAAELFQLDTAVSGVRIKVTDLFQARRIIQEIASNLEGRYFITDWTRQNANFFIALAQQRQMISLILVLIVAVAAFNIVSTLVMVVTDKAGAIAILRTLGLTPKGIMAIFMVQGCLIGLVGTLVGAAAGITLALHLESWVAAWEAYWGIHFLAADVYPIAQVPADLHWSDVGQITGLALSLSLLATLYPAWRAARTQPAEALRYD